MNQHLLELEDWTDLCCSSYGLTIVMEEQGAIMYRTMSAFCYHIIDVHICVAFGLLPASLLLLLVPLD